MPRSKPNTTPCKESGRERADAARLIGGEGKGRIPLEWRAKAREDLRAIVRYIGKDNPARARSFGQDLREKTKSLAQHPGLGRTGRPGLPVYVRELIAHPNYIIFYRVLAEARTVEILRVKHAALPTP